MIILIDFGLLLALIISYFYVLVLEAFLMIINPSSQVALEPIARDRMNHGTVLPQFLVFSQVHLLPLCLSCCG